MDRTAARQVTGSTRLRWMAAGAAFVLLVMGSASILSAIYTDDTAEACSPDGRICITRRQAPRILQVAPVDRLWISVDMHDMCGTQYPTPFDLPSGRIDATFHQNSVELHGPSGEQLTYPAAGC